MQDSKITGIKKLIIYTSFLGVALVLISCSPSKSSKLLSIQNATIPKAGVATLKSDQVTEFKLEGHEHPLFGIALKSCGYSKRTSLTGASRQIYVAFDKVEITKSEVTSSSNTERFRTEAQTILDDTSVDLIIYTEKRESCIFDVAFWGKPSIKNPATIETLGALESQLELIADEAFKNL